MIMEAEEIKVGDVTIKQRRGEIEDPELYEELVKHVKARIEKGTLPEWVTQVVIFTKERALQKGIVEFSGGEMEGRVMLRNFPDVNKPIPEEL